MKIVDETTSAERLLDLIRGKSDGVIIQQPSPSKPVKRLPKPVKTSKIKLLHGKKTSNSVVVGIDIGHTSVNLVKAARPNQKWEILESKSIPLPTDTGRRSDKFNDFLKSAVVPFCQGPKKLETWAIMSAEQVEVRLILVPKVSGKHFETAVYWTLKKELALNEKDYFFDYEVRGEVTALDGNKKLEVICYSVPLAEVKAVRELFDIIGVPLSGVSIVPFAVQNIFLSKIMTLPEKETACLFIGNSFSRIDLYTDGKLILTRDIKTGINSMIEILTDELNGGTGENGKFSYSEAQQILFAFTDSSDKDNVLTIDNGLVVNREEIDRIIAPVLERLVRQLERTFEHFTATLGHDRIEKIYISSFISVNEPMMDYISTQLGAKCSIFDPLEQLLPGTSLERNSLVPAFGAALSDNAYTPNFIYSYSDKKKTAYAARFNSLILAGLIVTILASAAIGVYEWQNIALKKTTLARLEQQIQKSAPLVSRETIIHMQSATGQRQQKFAQISKRYKGMALIGELSSLTPEVVSLTGLKADFSEKTTGGAIKAGNAVVLEGVITGNNDILETILASYVMRLRSSPMFSEASISTSNIHPSTRGAFLTFALNLKMGQGK